MALDPVEPTGPSRAGRKGGKPPPDEERFEKDLKVDKPDEVEYEGRRKRRSEKTEEEQKTESSPYEPTFEKPIKKPSPMFSEESSYEDVNLPSDTTMPYQSDYISPPPQKSSTSTPTSTSETPEKEKSQEAPKKEKSQETTKKRKKEEEAYLYAKMKRGEKKEKEIIVPEKKKGKIETKIKPPKKEEELEVSKKKKATMEHREEALPVEKDKTSQYTGGKTSINPFTHKKEKPHELTTPPPSQGIAVDHLAQAQASAITSKVQPFLSPDLLPLFDRMVGTVIQLSKNGISQTQIILNNPSFANSVFFGSKVFFERYSTAPDSFNIRLTGSQAAVEKFNANIETLQTAFQNSNLKSRVGRLTAEYEPLFRRKKSIGEESKDMGSTT